jgi:hypothetical protein
MKFRPITVGFLQATGLALYASLFVSIVSFLGKWEHTMDGNPFFQIGVILILFMTSALTCGAIALLYPIITLLDGRRKEAIFMVLYTILFLGIIFAILVAIASTLV